MVPVKKVKVLNVVDFPKFVRVLETIAGFQTLLAFLKKKSQFPREDEKSENCPDSALELILKAVRSLLHIKVCWVDW